MLVPKPIQSIGEASTPGSVVLLHLAVSLPPRSLSTTDFELQSRMPDVEQLLLDLHVLVLTPSKLVMVFPNPTMNVGYMARSALRMEYACCSAIALVGTAFAWQPIAHRGVFHDVDDSQANAENSIGALYRAGDLGLPGVELDLRLSSDGVVMVTHDVLTNRATTVDNYGGKLNSVDVALGRQPAVAGININSRTGSQWNDTPLKIYGRNAQLVTDGSQKMQTLDEMLSYYSNYISGNGGATFMLVLDIQSPEIFEKAADSVRKAGLETSVYLKFFATSAIDSSQYTYKGAETCAAYAHYSGLTGLRIIPQINNGEIVNKGGEAYINVFHTQLSIQDYLACWRDAERYRVSADFTHVAASVAPGDHVATAGAMSALQWAKQNGRGTISILPNPDACSVNRGSSTYWSFQSNNVAAKQFDNNARNVKQDFINSMNKYIDYVVVDTMGNVGSHTYYTDYDDFVSHLC
ncbi:glycerophosphodiester phosphodiesterase [Pseudozyma hubeiensis SY62]|uniref:Glycerophosphodiester phosphodiesterase n=1 Tax=Pseudozyma hubeiensis (strain SY62) TaxID=1305764 RepID=R9NZQ3_PSEHS|nr:glycerophosphodiester phosphodiesterase [Pseudozyma hubeiensis SY62]GAC94343.1 glycerophosphodiester phosphodiesterase [Pseudozyma hubeiensis SY62]